MFREGRFTNLDPTLTINQNKFLLSNPNWVITNKTSKHTYKLTSSQASVNFSNEKFIIKKPFLNTLLENKIENSISSDEANLELDKKKLVLKKKVHLQLPQTNGTIHLFTELLNLDIKNNLEDKWKSVNKINTSIVLPIRLSVDAKNSKFSEKLENTLPSIDLISNIQIEMFNNKEIIYKIIFNGTPDKLLDIMHLYDFKIDISKDVWKVQ